jgi:hypothetical protein
LAAKTPVAAPFGAATVKLASIRTSLTASGMRSCEFG